MDPDPFPLYQCLFPRLLDIVVTLVAFPHSICKFPILSDVQACLATHDDFDSNVMCL